jgi:hypothetical protein
MAPVGSPPPAASPVPHRRAVSYDDVVLQEAIGFARTPIESSFGGFARSSRRGVRTITHRLAHLIVRAERHRQYWTMVGAKYYLFHLEKAVGAGTHPDRTLQSFRIRLQEMVAEYEASEGELDISELERLVILSGNTPDRILVGQPFETSMLSFSNLPKIESELSRFVNIYMWDQTG